MQAVPHRECIKLVLHSMDGTYRREVLSRQLDLVTDVKPVAVEHPLREVIDESHREPGFDAGDDQLRMLRNVDEPDGVRPRRIFAPTVDAFHDVTALRNDSSVAFDDFFDGFSVADFAHAGIVPRACATYGSC